MAVGALVLSDTQDTVGKDEPIGKDGEEQPKKDTDILNEARDRYRLCQDNDAENKELAVNDLWFLAGEQWPAPARQQRAIAQRPCLTVNTLPTYLHQVTNDQRQNKVSIKVNPVDQEADEETAEVYDGLIRHIEVSSNADVSYNTATNSAAAIGIGFFRAVTEYCNERSFDQDIKIKRIRNPLAVSVDPLSTEPDGSDMQYCFIASPMARTDFEREYPKAEACNSTWYTNNTMQYPGWISEETVLICEYYKIEKTEADLYLATDNKGYFKEDPLPPGVTLTDKKRPTTKTKVMWYKITAVDVLEQTEIMCKWIPVFPVYGDEIDINGKVMREGIVRRAKDPSQMYNYWMTAATEEVAMRNKTPYIGAVGQFETMSDQWQNANQVPYATLEYDPIDVNGVLAPPPQRQPMADVPVGVLAMAAQARDNIKATTGLFDSSLGARGNATSGKQEIAQQRQGDMANFHYIDNRNISIKHLARCLINMIPFYYDTQRTIRILGEDGTAQQAEVNKPIPPEEQKEDESGRIKTILNDLSVGEYDLTVAVGPPYDSAAAEALDGMLTAGQTYPAIWDKAGDLLVRNMGWPGASKIADRLEKTLPPGLLDADEDQPMVQTPDGPVPVEQAGQIIAQMGEALKNASEAVDKAGVMEKEAALKELDIKQQEARTKQYDAETKRLTADADLLRAQMETGAFSEQINALVERTVQANILEIMDMPIASLAPLASHPDLQGQPEPEIGAEQPMDSTPMGMPPPAPEPPPELPLQ